MCDGDIGRRGSTGGVEAKFFILVRSAYRLRRVDSCSHSRQILIRCPVDVVSMELVSFYLSAKIKP